MTPLLLGAPVHLWLGLLLLEYHISELALVLLIEPEELSCESLLLSAPYIAAMAFGLAEYSLGLAFFSGPKVMMSGFLSPIGLALAIAGDALRKAAWLTARFAFTHKIKREKRPGHVLITSGVYRYIRHPGYLGWAVWAVGSQLLLGNVVSVALFAVVGYRFFRIRIAYEEEHLVRLFGDAYVRYREGVGTWMGV
jgi:protein-S-isoprenylcysteine O-methyltransferase